VTNFVVEPQYLRKTFLSILPNLLRGVVLDFRVNIVDKRGDRMRESFCLYRLDSFPLLAWTLTKWVHYFSIVYFIHLYLFYRCSFTYFACFSFHHCFSSGFELLERCFSLKFHFKGTWNSLKMRIFPWKLTLLLETCECFQCRWDLTNAACN